MSNRRFDEMGATQIVHRNEQGAIASAASASVCLVFSAVLIGLAFASDSIIGGKPLSENFVTGWVRSIIAAAVLPFFGTAWGKLAFLRGKLEADLYKVSGWKVDLDGDGRTGPDEALQQRIEQAPVTQLPEREVIRVVPVHNAVAKAEPTIRLPDGRELEAHQVRDFVIGAGTIGLGLTSWKERGWTRPEWETARDLLALHNLATKRVEGQVGKLTATPGQCMRAFGL